MDSAMVAIREDNYKSQQCHVTIDNELQEEPPTELMKPSIE
jgi:hypothetical protein